MGLWQRSMIALARREGLNRVMQRRRAASLMAGRFVGGASPESGVETALRLNAEFGITSSLFFLGEYVRDPARIEENVRNTIEAAERLGRAGLDVHVSIDPTAVGFMTSATLGRTNAERIARAVAGQPFRPHNYLMLDMEDRALLAPTLALHAELMDQGLPAAITLQARLRRTEQDVQPLVQRRTAVRLVKGAFPLGPLHDHRGGRAITESFLRIGSAMLSEDARRAGFYPVFATHDDALARQLIDLARSRGWEPEQYEFELLYGVRPDWQQELRSMGAQVRAYVPFGADWWPYCIRRVGENPANVLLLGRALLGKSYASR